MKQGYMKSTATKAEVYEVIEHATLNLLDAAGELAQFEYSASSSEIIDNVLSIAAKVEELKALHADDDLGQMPQNVVQFARKGGAE